VLAFVPYVVIIMDLISIYLISGSYLMGSYCMPDTVHTSFELMFTMKNIEAQRSSTLHKKKGTEKKL
jgi:hypothetical protein